MEEKVRLQKYLADCGIASRRKCEELILNGNVKVNGKIITELGTKINPKEDVVLYNNIPVKVCKNKYTYILLNKPIGYVSTVKDQFKRPTVLDLVKIDDARLVPVGRLDMYTSGAIILTDDGDFVYKVTHPKYEIEKTYTVTVVGKVSSEDVQQLRDGVQIEDYITQKAKVRILKYDETKNVTRLEIIIHEGKNREVRKMCQAINRKVIALHRSKIGNIDVKELKLGQWRYLSTSEKNSFIR